MKKFVRLGILLTISSLQLSSCDLSNGVKIANMGEESEEVSDSIEKFEEIFCAFDEKSSNETGLIAGKLQKAQKLNAIFVKSMQSPGMMIVQT